MATRELQRGRRAVDAGNQSVANAQLNIAANHIWAMLFTVRMQ